MNFGDSNLYPKEERKLGSMSSSNEHSKKLLARGGLQGPRPPPLKVCKDSCKIKKPQTSLPVGSHRLPVIIYAKSPEVIHAEAHDFMTLVQRLTGISSSSSSSLPLASPSSLASSSLSLASSSFQHGSNSAMVNIGRSQEIASMCGENRVEELDTIFDAGRMATTRGVLSPIPSELPLVSPGYFLPSPNAFPSVYDFGPILYTPNYQDSLFISPRFNL